MIIGAFMVPHPPIAVHEIGKGEEKQIQPTLDSFHETAEFIRKKKPETIILITPHSICYRDWFNVSDGAKAFGDFSMYRASSVQFEVSYDQDFTEWLTDLCEKEGFPAGTQYDREKYLDQGTMVPLYFLNQVYDDYKLVRISLSGLSLADHYRFGMLIQQLCMESDRRYLIMGSGDLSHCQKADGPYGLKPEGPVYDERIMKTMGTASFRELMEYDAAFLEKAEECGHRSFTIMAGILDRLAVRPTVLTHEATLGVGYGFVLYDVTGRDDSRNFLDQYEENVRSAIRNRSMDAYVSLARRSVETWIKDRRICTVPEDCPKELTEQKAGVFVSIHENGMLRGCIGTIYPTRRCIAEEIIHNGISACSRDPRFDPVKVSELPYLEISVDVLGAPEKTDREGLDVKRYGIICSTKDGRKGLLLPDLDGVDTVDQQISIACSKGGIDPDFDKVILERFEVIRHE
jgi:AmmeMemoRadiSam system protein A